MRSRRNARRDQAYVVTEARQSRSAEISQRERRYLAMMGIRVVCFVVTVVMFVNHAGWLTAIPAAGAIVLPYFAVVVANARREAGGAPGFRAYEPALPERYVPPDSSPDPTGTDPTGTDPTGTGPTGTDQPGASLPATGQPGARQSGTGHGNAEDMGTDPGSGVQ